MRKQLNENAQLAILSVFTVLLVACAWILGGCAALRESAQAPCPPHALASIDARFAAEAIATCKAEGADADTCRALPAIRAKYARERQAWVECKGEP